MIIDYFMKCTDCAKRIMAILAILLDTTNWKKYSISWHLANRHIISWLPPVTFIHRAGDDLLHESRYKFSDTK
jgi:hypothetical protein